VAIFVKWCCYGRTDRWLGGITPDAKRGRDVRKGRSRRRPPRAGSEEGVGVDLQIRSTAGHTGGRRRRWRTIERTRDDGSDGQRQRAAAPGNVQKSSSRCGTDGTGRRAETTRTSYRDGYGDVLRTEWLSRPERPQKMAPRMRRKVVRGENGHCCRLERDVRRGRCAGYARRPRRYGR